MVVRNISGFTNPYSKPVHQHKEHKAVPFEQPGGCPRDAVNMPGHRHRRSDGQLIKKRSDTHAATLRKECHVSIPTKVPARTPLKILRQMTGKVGVHQVSIALRMLEKSGVLEPMLDRFLESQK